MEIYSRTACFNKDFLGGHPVFENPATQVPENPKAEHVNQVVMLTQEICTGPNCFWLCYQEVSES